MLRTFAHQNSNLYFQRLALPFFCLALLIATGCDNRYYDEHMKMEVQQLDSDLENRWSTSGVVVLNTTPNGPADKGELKRGELISYVITEYPIQSTRDFNSTLKKAIDKDNNLILHVRGKPPLRLALRKSGDKPGLKVEGKGTVRVKEIQPGTPAANTDIQIGDIIEKIVDERKIYSIGDYKDAIGDVKKGQIVLRTSELIGVKIAAVNALGELGDTRAVEPLVDIFKNSTELSLRKEAAKSLERLVELSALNELFQQFQNAELNQLPADSLPQKQLEAAAILGLLTVDITQNHVTLKEPFGTQFRQRADALHQKINQAQLVTLAAQYSQLETEPEQEIRRACLEIIGILKPRSAIEALVHVLKNTEEIPGIRFQAALALSKIGEPAVEQLIDVFQGGDTSTKDMAASALGDIGGEKARALLIRALENADEPAIQLTLVDAIAKIGDAPSLEALQRQRQRFRKDDTGIRIFLEEVFKNATPEMM